MLNITKNFKIVSFNLTNSYCKPILLVIDNYEFFNGYEDIDVTNIR
jgi:hypothetical protein